MRTDRSPQGNRWACNSCQRTVWAESISGKYPISVLRNQAGQNQGLVLGRRRLCPSLQKDRGRPGQMAQKQAGGAGNHHRRIPLSSRWADNPGGAISPQGRLHRNRLSFVQNREFSPSVLRISGNRQAVQPACFPEVPCVLSIQGRGITTG